MGRKREPQPERRPKANARGWAAAVLVVAVVLVAGVALQRTLARPVPLPPPTRPPPQPRVAAEDFVGAETCGSCHRAEYQLWRASTHGRAGGPPGPAVVIAPFDGTPIRFRDATVIPRAAAGGRYQFVVRQPGRAEAVLEVAAVIGGGHLVGGGTQGFLTAAPDGTLRFLPFDFIRGERRWFCNTLGRANRGWVPIDTALRLEACVDWPPRRVLGTLARFSNCQECHGSQIRLGYDTTAARYRTDYRDLRINCESCHGPGRRHVDLARAGILDTAADIGMSSLVTLDRDRSLEVCFRCHALKDVLRTGYLPGEVLAAYYSLGLAGLGDRPWFPDGRVRTFAYQENHRFSACYVNGSMTCVDCHEPHGQRYRDIWNRPLPGRFDDGQCVDCHASKVDRIAAHTHHPADSPGSRCVACHMPYFQHPELGRALRFARSDHTIAIPRPGFDAAQGLASACQQCHRNRSDAELEAAARAWWGEIKPHHPLVRALLELREATSLEAAAQALLRPELDHPLAQVQALGTFLERYLGPDLERLPADVIGRLERLAANRDPDVAALALASLHWAGSGNRSIRRFLARSLAGLGDRDWLVRSRWKLVLAYLGDSYRERGEARRALLAYQRALEVVPNDAAVLGNMGLAYATAGQWSEAVDAYRRSLALDRRQPLVWVNLGLALEALGDAAGAADAYRQALAVDRHEPVAWLDLGNVYLRQGNVDSAAAYYRRALEADWGLAPAHFNLARVYAAAGRWAEAESQVEWGLAFEPDHPDGQQLRQQIRQLRPARPGPGPGAESHR